MIATSSSPVSASACIIEKSFNQPSSHPANQPSQRKKVIELEIAKQRKKHHHQQQQPNSASSAAAAVTTTPATPCEKLHGEKSPFKSVQNVRLKVSDIIQKDPTHTDTQTRYGQKVARDRTVKLQWQRQ